MSISTEGIELDALAVFSHPDDAELTVAGTLLKLKRQGYRTGVVDVTRGEMGTRGTLEGRTEEARAAARILGLDVRLNLGQPDGHVHVTEESRRAMVRVIRTHRPKVIFTAHWDDPHPDHAAAGRAAAEAAPVTGSISRSAALVAPSNDCQPRRRMTPRVASAPSRSGPAAM